MAESKVVKRITVWHQQLSDQVLAIEIREDGFVYIEPNGPVEFLDETVLDKPRKVEIEGAFWLGKDVHGECVEISVRSVDPSNTN